MGIDPGFVGVGTILAGLLGENTRHNLERGLNLIVVSAVIFLVFATFFGGLSILGDYGAAVALILLVCTSDPWLYAQRVSRSR